MGSKITNINLTYLLSKKDIIYESRLKGYLYEKTLRERIYLSSPKLKGDWTLEISSLFDVIEQSNQRTMRHLKSMGFSFNIVEETTGTTPFLLCCFNSDNKSLYALIEDGKYKFTKKEAERGVEICLKPQYLEGSVSYSSVIIEYLKRKHIID